MTATLARTAAAPTGEAHDDVAARAPRPRASRARTAAWIVLGLILVAAVAALVSVDISIPRMVQSWGNAVRFAGRIHGLTLPEPADLVRLTAQTLGFVITGTALAAVLSVPVAVLAASNTSPGPVWQGAARFVGVLARSVPDVVLAMVFVLMFSLGSLPGILAIGIHSVGMLSKMFADAIEQIDEGPRLAIRAAGGSRTQELAAGVLPQVAPSWVANVLHRNDINLRGSVILGYVGVAGLGLQMSYAFKALDYGRGLGLAAVIFALCVVMEVVSAAVRAAMLGAGVVRARPMDRLVARLLPRRAGGGSAAGLPAASPATPADALRRPWTRARVRTAVALAVAAVVLVGAVLVSDVTWSDLGSFWARIPAVAAQLWPPTAGAYGWDVLVGAMGQTVVIALAAALLTLAGSAVVGALAARNVAPGPGMRGVARLVLVAVRGVPELILAIVLIVISGLGMQAGTLALAVGGVGLLGKLVADSLEEVDPGPERALAATGATRPQVLAAATLPQAARAMLGHGFYLLDTNVRAATLLGIVGGGGVGYYLLNASEGARYGMVTAIVLMILATVLVIEGLAVWMRRVLR
ncbi:PhnE/PtxC family ABC transporter permease [Clavibacter sp. Sh2088]|uniref:PhnE/PtxC family ABC transporter permease n=1 Tax=Clavibacter sp. Sh2088 TaxID=3397676 RepID=UPI0039E0AC50